MFDVFGAPVGDTDKLAAAQLRSLPEWRWAAFGNWQPARALEVPSETGSAERNQSFRVSIPLPWKQFRAWSSINLETEFFENFVFRPSGTT